MFKMPPGYPGMGMPPMFSPALRSVAKPGPSRTDTGPRDRLEEERGPFRARTGDTEVGRHRPTALPRSGGAGSALAGLALQRPAACRVEFRHLLREVAQGDVSVLIDERRHL
jgi:hypothetical protein